MMLFFLALLCSQRVVPMDEFTKLRANAFLSLCNIYTIMAEHGHLV